VLGSHTLVVNTSDLAGNTASQTVQFQIKDATGLVYNGSTSGDYDDAVTLSATLSDTSVNPSVGISGVSISFTLGSQSCTATTGSSGKATCSPLTLNQQPASVSTVGASFAGSSIYLPTSTTPPANFTINKEETTLSITSQNALPAGSVSVAAKLLEDGTSVPNPGGQSVTFTATPSGGGAAVTGAGAIDATGTAKTTLALPIGAYTLSASFAGDNDYLPSSATAQTLYVYGLPASGGFVIGDKTPQTVGSTVNFWGSQWTRNNSFSGGAAPNSMKGWAENLTPSVPACGGSYTTATGDSSNPTAGPLPSYMAVLVSTLVNQAGSTISGNVVHIVVVQTAPGYQNDPGHPGMGVVVATVC
jgi:hypothetical protein